MKCRGGRDRAENRDDEEYRGEPHQLRDGLVRNATIGIGIDFRILLHCLSPSISISFWLDASVSELPQMSGTPGDSSTACNSPLVRSSRTSASEVAIISAAFSGEMIGTSAPHAGQCRRGASTTIVRRVRMLI